MGLGTMLLGMAVDKAVQKTVNNAGKIAAAAAVGVGAAAVAGTAHAISSSREERRQRIVSPTSKADLSYSIDVFYAKLAVCTYIANADGMISGEEDDELATLCMMAEETYGDRVLSKAYDIIGFAGNNFMTVEQYLSKVRTEDLDTIMMLAQEMAEADDEVCKEEKRALNKILTYINGRKGIRTEFSFERESNPAPQPVPQYIPQPQQPNSVHVLVGKIDLTCPCCAAMMRMDRYGYLAECEYCGLETVINANNAPIRRLEQREAVMQYREEPVDAYEEEDTMPEFSGIPDFPTVPVRPEMPRWKSKANMDNYKRALMDYDRQIEVYKKAYKQYQNYVLSHPV